MSGAVAEICRGGKHFTSADTEERKQLFTTALPAHVPLARLVRQVLDERGNHRASAVRFRDELEVTFAQLRKRYTSHGYWLASVCRTVQLRRGGGAVQFG